MFYVNVLPWSVQNKIFLPRYMFVVWNSLVWRININTLHQKVADSSRRLSSISLCHSSKKRILDLMEGLLWGIIFTMLQNAANWLKLRRIKTIAWLSQWTTYFAHFTADDYHLPSVIHLWPYFRVINTCSETVWSVEIKRTVSRCSPIYLSPFKAWWSCKKAECIG